MDAGLSMKECDPWATYVDKRSGVQPGMKRAEMLTETERSVYDFVKGRGRVTREEVMEGLGLSETDLKVQLVPLMHSELVKEAGEGGKLYLVSVG
jgi:predicted HTH transcriptional regulator